MLSVIDRYLLRSLVVNYVIALGAMLSLYVVLDMFVNMDEFTEHGFPFTTVVGHIAGYYAPHLLLYFAQLSGAITLFACMTSLARMRRANELTAILASGVSLHRVARPIIAFGIATTGLLLLDTEILIPSVAHQLARSHDDANGSRAYSVLFMRDKRGALLSAGNFHPTTRDLRQLLVLERDEKGDFTAMVEADHATWEPPTVIRPTGRWRLERGRRIERGAGEQTGLGPREMRPTTPAEYYETDLSPEAIQMRQAEGWIRFLSLRQLAEHKRRAGPNFMTVVQTMHQRRAQPIIALVLLLLGLPFYLNRSPATVLSDSGKCMIACGLCYVVTFVAQSLRPADASALPAWIPIFVFGTLAIVLIDRIRT